MEIERDDHFVGNPLDVRNCLTVDALMPKFTFSGIDLVVCATFILFMGLTQITPMRCYYGPHAEEPIEPG